jgi:hypothetical protein
MRTRVSKKKVSTVREQNWGATKLRENIFSYSYLRFAYVSSYFFDIVVFNEYVKQEKDSIFEVLLVYYFHR